MRLICMKYRIIFLIINHYQPGSNIIIVHCKHITHARMHVRTDGRTHARTYARTDARTRGRTHARPNGRTHARTRVRTHPRERVHTNPPHTHTQPSPYRYSMGLCQPTVTARSAGYNSWSLAIEINTGTGGPVSPRF